MRGMSHKTADQEKRQTSSDIAEHLEFEIVRGVLQPGERLSEHALSQRLGVGRASLREAIRILEGRRLVERTPFAGVRVIELSADDLEQILMLREALEGMAARQAAENMSLPEIHRIKEILAAEERLETEGAGAVFKPGTQDNDFHLAITRASRNRWLLEVLCRDLYSLLRIFRFRAAHLNLGDRAMEAHHEHVDILAAIERRDPDAAESLMRAHVRRGRTRLLADLRRQ